MNRILPPGRGLRPYEDPYDPAGLSPVATDEEELDIDLRSIWGLVQRNKLLILACILAASALAWLYNVRATPYYQSTTTLRINDDSRSSAGTGELNLTLFQNGSAIETEIAVLQSRMMAQSVAESLAMRFRIVEPLETAIGDLFRDVQLPYDAPPRAYTLRRDGSTFAVLDAEGRRLAVATPGTPTRLSQLSFTLTPKARNHDRIQFVTRSLDGVVGEIRSGLTVQRPSRDQSIIEIRFEGPDPRYVARTANALAHRFRMYRRSVQQTEASSTIDFLTRQIDTLAIQLRTAEDELREFREQEQIVSLTEEGASSIERFAALETQRDLIRSERNGLSELLVELDQADRQQRDPLLPSPARRLMAYPGLAGNAGASQMLSTLIMLENERAALLGRRKPDDPDVQVLTGRIHGVEDELRLLTGTYLKTLDSQLVTIESQLQEGATQLAEFPGKEAEYLRLLRKTTLLEGIYGLLQADLKEAQIAQAVETPYATVIDPALVPNRPVRPHKIRNLLLAIGLGLVVGIGAAFGREHLDNTVHTVDEVEALTGVPVLGMIPHMRNHQLTNGKRRLLPGRARTGLPAARDANQDFPSRLIVSRDTQNTVAEAFRSLRTNITFATPDQVPRTIVVTSSREGDGKTTSVVNLAAAFAHQGLKVLLVDSDLRRGVLHKVFKLPKRPGLSNVLVENLPLGEVIHAVAIDTEVHLDVMTSGTYPPNPAELLGSSRLRAALDSLAKLYDVVLIDSPPLTVVTDAAVVAPHVDGVLVVARASQTEVGALEFAMLQLRNVNARVKGTILNDLGMNDRRHGSQGYYAYTYEYTKRDEE
ncbi:MAG TPA: polysaccharide biosynthesis tyrosine autokinase [Gemmatimonadota bacterium]|nr:polysaccharide biosynthesis tyrosine autokinase [Gemmatimonadota bacterium]